VLEFREPEFTVPFVDAAEGEIYSSTLRK